MAPKKPLKQAKTDHKYTKPDNFATLTTEVVTGDAYAEYLHLAHPTTKDITVELNTKAQAFIDKATKRIKELMDLVVELRADAEAARTALNEANKTLHALLPKMSADDSAAMWLTGDENK
ncbi:hypothetical protein B0T19DRAFT_297765 [Cercophora scortea]|uniref:Uncharacterized protein n=1 Tax=Cercophora scortea TaxID=314031 RepID=A0AAE0I3B2_9PEZI|nr:hypothetical protein B0T19DRAFT_297765 [Cercophora scortea]